jgi:hypothetical protein
MSDFEIEGDEEESFGWGNKYNVPQQKKSNTLFGAGADADDDGYDYAYKPEPKKVQKYEPFSPVGQAPQSSFKDPASHKPAVVVASSQDAMERAQSMLNRYSNKAFAAPSSNFRNQKVRTFNEDEMSMSSSEDAAPSDFDMSESNEDAFNTKVTGVISNVTLGSRFDCGFSLTVVKRWETQEGQ